MLQPFFSKIPSEVRVNLRVTKDGNFRNFIVKMSGQNVTSTDSNK